MNDYNEMCWNTGIYSDCCDCMLCSHKDECSGSDMEDDE